MLKYTRKSNKAIAILTMVITLAVVMLPMIVLATEDETTPVITPGQPAGEVKVGTELKFTITDDTDIAYVYYAWNRRIDGNKKTVVTVDEGNTQYELTVKAPTEPGIYEFSIAAHDFDNNVTSWMNIPYVVVDEENYTGKIDTTKPVFDFKTPDEYPYNNSTIEPERTITIKANDESGMYYIGYKWSRELDENDYVTNTTYVYAKDEFQITAPSEPGVWYLQLYGRDAANNLSGGYYTKLIIEEEQPGDYTNLKEKINSTSTLISSDYTEETWKLLQDKISESNTMISENKAKQAEIDEQVTSLDNIINSLQPVEVNKTALAEFVEGLNGLVGTDYTNWDELQTKITDADAIKLQSEFDKEVENIKAFTLTAKTVNTASLDKIEEELNSLDESAYTQESWKAIQDQIAEAKTKTLQSEFDAIVEKIDLTTLEFIDYVVSIEVVPPTKTEYVYKEELNLDGASVKITMASGNVTQEPIINEMIEGYDSSVIGEQTITVKCEEKTATFTVEVKKADYDISNLKFENKLLTYDGQYHTIDVTGLPEGVEVEYSSGHKRKSVGSMTCTATFKGDYDHYNTIEPMKAVFAVVPANITVTIDNKESVYGNNLETLTSNVTGGTLFNDDDLKISLKVVDNDENEVTSSSPVGTYKIIGEWDNSNYNVTFENGEYKITARDAEVTINNQSSVYGEPIIANENLTYSVTGTVNDDNLNITLTKTDGVTVGKYAITGAYNNSNYNVTFKNGEYEITKRNITIKAKDISKVYGEQIVANNDLEYEVTDGSIVNNDNLNIALTKADGATVGKYDISVEASNDNYNITLQKGIYEITVRPVTVTIANKTSVYGNTLKKLTYTIPDGAVVADDNLNIKLKKEDGISVGTYKITGEYDNSNYNVTFENGEYEITKRDITVTAANKTSIYGDVLESLTYDMNEGSSIVNDDKIEIELKAVDNDGKEITSTSSVGKYKIVGTASDANYNVTVTSGEYEITKRPVTVTVDNKTSTYGEELEKLTCKVTEGTKVSGDMLNVKLTKAEGTTVGTYDITGEAKNTNYSVTVIPGTYEITAREVAISINNLTSVYGEELKELTYNVPDGAIVNNDNLNISLKALDDQGNRITNVSSVGKYAITGEYNNPNYNVTFTPGEYGITARPVTVTIENKTSAYGEALKDLTYTIPDGAVINGDNLNIRLSKADGTTVGTYDITGEYNNSNYNVTFEKGIYEITKIATTKDLLSATIASTTYNKGQQGVTVVAKDGVSGLGKITVKYDGSETMPINAGIYKITVDVAEGDNYAAAEGIELDDFVINKQPVTVKIDSKTSVYGNALAELTSSGNTSTGVVEGDDLGITLKAVKEVVDGEDRKEEEITSSTPVGTYTIKGEATNTNYEVTFENGTYTITKRETTQDLLSTTIALATYNKEPQGVTVEGIDGLGKITVKYDGSKTMPVNAGTYKVTADVEESENYLPATGIELGEFTIKKQPVTVKIDNKESAYGDALEGLTSSGNTSTGVFDGDNLGIILTKAEGTAAGEYAITGTATNTNYEVTFENGTYTITKRQVTMTIINATSVYGEDISNYQPQLSNGSIITGDELNIELSKEQGIEVGKYAINAKYNNDNYEVTFENAQYEITPRPISIKIDDKSSKYKEEIAKLTTTITDGNKVRDDDLGITLKAVKEVVDGEGIKEEEITSSTPVGTYTITGDWSNKNYNVTFTPGTYTITRATYDMSGVTFRGRKTTYDGQAHYISVKEDTLPENVKIDKYTGNGMTNAGTYTVTVSFKGDADNYEDITPIEVTLNIAKASLTSKDFTVLDNSKTYTGTPQTADVSSNIAEISKDIITTKYYKDGIEVENPTDEGAYVIKVSTEETTNYNAVNEMEVGTLSIGRKVLTDKDFTVSDTTKTYDGTIQTATVTPNIDEIKDAMTVKYYKDGVEVENPTNAGEYTIKVSTSQTANYEALSETEVGKMIIGKATYNMDNVQFEGKTKTYDGQVHTIEITGDLPSGVTPHYENNSATNAGTYNATVTFTGDADNYQEIEPKSATLKIKKRKATITPDTIEVEYGEQEKQLTYTQSNVVENDNLNVSLIREEGTTVGEYKIKATANNDNYNITLEEGVYKITPRKVTITILDKTSVYGEELVSRNYRVTEGSIITGDDLHISVDRETSGSDATTYVIGGTYNNANYDVKWVKGTYTITPRPITVTIDNKTSAYGENLVELTSSITDGTVIGGDNLGITLKAVKEVENGADEEITSSTPVGKYAIKGDWSNNNYAVTFIPGEYEITKSKAQYTVPQLSAVTYNPKLTLASISLPENWEWVDNSIVPTVKVTSYKANYISKDGNYESVENIDIPLTVIKADYNLSGISFADAEVEYDGTEHSLAVSGKTLPKWIKVDYENNNQVNVGEYTVTAKFTVTNSNYNSIGDMTATLKITKATYNMDNVKFEDKTVTYDGTEHSVTTTGELPENISVAYENNVGTTAGTYDAIAKFTVDGNHNAIDNKTAKLIIAKADLTSNDFTVTNNNLPYTGNTQQANVTANIAEIGTVTVSYYQGETKVDNPTAAGSYDIKVSTAETTNYNAVNEMKVGTLSIGQLALTIDNFTLSNNTTIYNKGAQFATVSSNIDEVKDAITVKYYKDGVEVEKPTNAGEYTVKVSTVATANYSAFEETELGTYTIEKATYDISNITFHDNSFTYNGNYQSIKIDNEELLPDGVTVKYEHNSRRDVGDRDATAYFEVADKDNYNEITTTLPAKITITPATYDMSNVTFSGTDAQYDGKTHSISVNEDTLPDGVTVSGYVGNEQTDAGSHKVTVSFTGDTKNYNAIPPQDVTLNITRATLTANDFALEDTSKTYDGNAQYPTVKSAIEEIRNVATVVYYQGATKVDNPTNAGTYTVKVLTTEATTNYNQLAETELGTYTIAKADLTAKDFTVGDDAQPYDGNAKQATVTTSITEIGTVTVSYYQGETKVDTPTAAGSYDIKVSTAETANYKAVNEMKVGTLSIGKLALTANDFTIGNNNPAYTGNAQSANVTTSITEIGDITVTYYQGETKVEKPVNAGDYTVKVSTAETANYAKTEEMEVGTFTIARANLTANNFALEDTSKTYNGSAQYPTVKSAISEIGTVTPTYYQGGTKVDNPTNAGTYTVKVSTTAETANYNKLAETELGTYTIAKADLTANDFTVTNNNLPYTGNTQKATVTANIAEIGTVTDSYYQGETKIDEPKAAGSYDIKVSTAETANYNAVNEMKVGTLSIGQLALTVDDFTFDNTSKTYTGTTQTATVTPNIDEIKDAMTVKYYKNGSEVEPVDAGDYTVKVSTVATANYSAFEETELGTYTISRATLTASEFTIGNNNPTYTGNAQDANVTTSITEIGDITVTYYQGETKVENPTNAGDYTVKVSTAETTNYAKTEEMEVGTFTIARANLTASDFALEDTAKTYNGKAQYPTVKSAIAEIKNVATVVYYQGSRELKKPTNSGTYTVKVLTTAETANYNKLDEIELGTYTIAKADLTEKDFKIEKDTFPYDGNAKQATVTTSITEIGNITVTYYQGETKVENPTVAGSYDIKVSTVESKNYNAVNEMKVGTLSIGKLTLKASDFTIENNNSAYIGNAQDAKVTTSITEIGDITVTYYQGETKVEKPVNVGDYTVKVSTAETANYAKTEEMEVGTFTIARANLTANDFTLEDTSKTYNGNAQYPTVKSNISEIGNVATVVYYQGSKELKKPTNAGTYTVKVLTTAETANYNKLDEIELGTYTIAKADLTEKDFKIEKDTFPYDGNAKQVNVTANIAEIGIVTPTYYQGETKVDTPTAAGSYDIKVSTEESRNYNAVNEMLVGTLSIGKLTLTANDFTIGNINPTYTGNVQDANVTTSITEIGDITVTYYQGETKVENPANAGDYMVKVSTAETTNYAKTEEMTVGTFTIVRATLTANDFTIENNNPTYTGNVQDANVTTSITEIGDITVTYYQGETKVENPINAGDYTVKVSTKETTNYNAVNEMTVGTLSIGKVTLTTSDFALEDTAKTYNGKAQYPTVKSAIAEIGNVAKVVYYQGSRELKKPTNAGTYTVKVLTTEATTNYNQLAETELGTYTISKVDLTEKDFTVRDDAQPYDGNVKQATVTTSITEIGNITVAYYQGETKVDNPTAAGSYDIKVSTAETANYKAVNEMKVGTLSIGRLTLTVDDFTFDNTSKTYNGSAQYPTVSSTIAEIGNVAKVVYYQGETKVEKPVNAGTYTVKVLTTAETTNYNQLAETELGTYTIERATLTASDFTIGNNNPTYTGNVQDANVTTSITEIGNITVTYYQGETKVENPTNVGDYTIKVSTEETTNYNAVNEMTVGTLSIGKITLTADDFTLEDTSKTYDGNAQYPKVSSSIAEIGKVAKVVYYQGATKVDNPTNAGTYTVKVLTTKATTNYNKLAETELGTYTIAKADLTEKDFTVENDAQPYDGNEKQATVTTSITGIGNITVSYYQGETKVENPTNIGDYTIKVSTVESTNYNAVNEMTVGTLSIGKLTLKYTDFDVTDNKKPYTGSAQTATVTSKVDELAGLVTVSYYQGETKVENPTNAGTYTIKVSTTAETVNYKQSGEITVGSFTIEPISYDMSGVTFDSKTVTYDGTKQEITINGTLPSGVTVSYENNSGINAQTYNAVAKFTGDANHNAIQDMTATLTINKADYNMSGVTFANKTVVYNGSEHKVVISGSLPSGVTVDYENNVGTDAGEYNAVAKFTGDANHNDISNMTATLTINKADYDMSKVTFANKTVTYNGTEQAITVDGLSSDITVNYENNIGTDVGTYTAVAKFTGDANNYNAIPDMTATLTITKANQETPNISLSKSVVLKTTTTMPVLTINNQAQAQGNISYESSNTDIATIDNSGNITLTNKATGNVVFTVKFNETQNYKESSAVVTLNVTEEPKMVIVLNGKAEETVEVNTTYTDLGAKAYEADSETGYDAQVESYSVDITKVGQYKITYSYANAESVTRTVNVVDTTAPEITIAEDKALTISRGATFNYEEGVTATDNYDEKVEYTYSGTVDSSTPGNYTIIYSAKDLQGNETTKEITVTVLDYAPLICYYDTNGILTEIQNRKTYNRYLNIVCNKGIVYIKKGNDEDSEFELYDNGILKDGDYTIKVDGLDGTYSEKIFTIDTIPADVEVTKLGNAKVITFGDMSDITVATLTKIGNTSVKYDLKELLQAEGKNSCIVTTTELENQDGDSYMLIVPTGAYTLEVEDAHGIRNATVQIKVK